MVELLILAACVAPMLIPNRVRWDRVRARRALEHALWTRITNVDDGRTATVRGDVRPGDEPVLTAPLSSRSCVAWELELAEDVGSDVVARGVTAASCSFLLEDDSGIARIAPARPLLIAEAGEVGRFRLGRVPARCVAAIGPGFQRRTKGLLVITERLVTLGASVMVRGGAAREPDPGAIDAVSGYRDQLPTRPVLSGTRRVPLIIRVDKAA